MGAKAAREAVAGLLEGIDGLRVVPHADDVTPEPGAAVALVWVDLFGATAEQRSTLAALTYAVKIQLAVAKSEPGKADDDLDTLADAVRGVLDAHPTLLWQQARRGLYLDDRFPSYVFDTTLTMED